MRNVLVWLCAVLLAGTAVGQSSSSFTLEEYAFNAGGAPSPAEPSSTGFRIGLASVGSGLAATGQQGGSFRIDAGFVEAYAPPGEVAAACGAPGESCLTFSDGLTLTWPAERSAGVYNVYRDPLSNLASPGFGQCHEQDLVAATLTDGDAVPSNDGYAYLVTVENRLAEEGTRGFRVEGLTMIERGGAVCP